MIDFKVNTYYNNHILKTVKSYGFSDHDDCYYICEKCNINLIFNRTNNKYYAFINDRDYSFYDEKLTCDEIIIKGIIE